MKCEICMQYEARSKDYREFDGCTGKFMVCNWCRNLNDVAVFQIRQKAGDEEQLDPVSFYDHINYDKMDWEELEELKDKKYDEVCEQLIDDTTDLESLLEMERALTLMEEQPGSDKCVTQVKDGAK